MTGDAVTVDGFTGCGCEKKKKQQKNVDDIPTHELCRELYKIDTVKKKRLGVCAIANCGQGKHCFFSDLFDNLRTSRVKTH